MKRLLIKLLIGIVAFITISFAWVRSLKTSIDSTLCSELREYCKQHNLCTSYCIIVDYSIYSGKERLFVVDLQNNRIDHSGLCSHGIGKDFDCIFTPRFSNKNGSNTRGILIHDGLPDICLLGLPCLPLSQGCFTVSDDTFKIISSLMNDTNTSVLLYSSDKSIF